LSKKSIVILGAGILQAPLIKEAKKNNFFCIVVDKNPNAVGRSLADIFLNISIKDSDLLIKELTSLNQSFLYCTTIGTDVTNSVALVSKHFNLEGLDPQQSELTTHKGKMRTFLRKLNLIQPPSMYSSEKDLCYEWANENPCNHGFVMKPVQNMGARGVFYLDKISDISFAFEYSQNYSENNEVILEHFIPAREISVDALVFNGKVYVTGIADRHISLFENRFFIETGHTMPAYEYKKILNNITTQLQIVSDGLSNITEKRFNGALKGDIRITNKNEFIIGEVATRLSGGFMSTHTYPSASGNNLMQGYLDIIENKLPAFIRENKNNEYPFVSIERAIISEPGILLSTNISNGENSIFFCFFY